MSKGYTGEYEDELDDLTGGTGEEEVPEIVRHSVETKWHYLYLLLGKKGDLT